MKHLYLALTNYLGHISIYISFIIGPKPLWIGCCWAMKYKLSRTLGFGVSIYPIFLKTHASLLSCNSAYNTS